MGNEQQRHDISDGVWALLEPHMSGRRGQWGGIAKDNRQFIKGISAGALLADRGYDTDEIIAYATTAGIEVVIPSKRNRKQQRAYDRYLYRLRHLVENAFLHLKRWRGIATRYAKNTASFLAAVQIRCIAIWCAILA